MAIIYITVEIIFTIYIYILVCNFPSSQFLPIFPPPPLILCSSLSHTLQSCPSLLLYYNYTSVSLFPLPFSFPCFFFFCKLKMENLFFSISLKNKIQKMTFFNSKKKKKNICFSFISLFFRKGRIYKQESDF